MGDKEISSLLDRIARSILEKTKTKQDSDNSSRESVVKELKSIGELEDFIRVGNSIVIFYNPTCPACKRYLPVVEAYAKKGVKGFKFAKISTVDVKGVSRKYTIIAVPTTIAFRNGREVRRTEGFMSEDELNLFIKTLPV